LVAAVLSLGACKHGDPIVSDWNEELDRPVSTADYRLKNAYCSAAAHSERAGADGVRRRCGAVAYAVIAVVSPQFLPTPPAPFAPTLAAVQASEACKAACEALAYADRSDGRYGSSTAEVAQHCGACNL